MNTCDNNACSGRGRTHIHDVKFLRQWDNTSMLVALSNGKKIIVTYALLGESSTLGKDSPAGEMGTLDLPAVYVLENIK